MKLKKIHLGCGREILPGFINLDSVPLPGVDVVHNLAKMPWPFENGVADEIILVHVLEHLPNTIAVMEELWRISAPGAKIMLRVPYWNSRDFITDPTHVKAFNEHSFDFFDPDSKACQLRSYYSKARFRIKKKTYYFSIFGRYYAVRPSFFCALLELPAQYISNVIQVMEFELEAVK